MGEASARELEPRGELPAPAADRPLSDFSYVLPWRSAEPAAAEAVDYLRRLATWCPEVILVDGSPSEAFAANARAWGGFVRQVAPDPGRRCLMGKVAGVLSGLDLARFDRVVVADDDIRYGREELARVVALLDDNDLVRPQNYFRPLPWHARWDTARGRCSTGPWGRTSRERWRYAGRSCSARAASTATRCSRTWS